MIARLVVAALAVALGAMALAAPGSVVDTRHNLSASGPGPIRATTEDEVCVFCHIAHPPESGDALWNHVGSSELGYLPYDSSTLRVRPGQPNGDSLLCLSCHDGTIAIGAVKSRDKPIQVLGTGVGGRFREDDLSNMGIDLSGTHPFSMDYDDAAIGQPVWSPVSLRLLTAGTAGSELLDAGRDVQCTSCHDPHTDPAADGLDVPPFWRGGRFSDVCERCHVAPLVDRVHGDDTLLPDGCGSCHVGHGVSGERLLPEREEEACFRCHGAPEDVLARVAEGQLTPRARPDLLESVFSTAYHHPVVESVDRHDRVEDLRSEGAGANRHAECVDCHTVHGEEALPSAGLRGVGAPVSGTLGGEPESDVCYRCHGNNANLPYGSTDKSEEFDPNNESFHPVEAPARTGGTPSLLSPWREGDLLTCSSCHGSGRPGDPAGPHGSDNAFLLAAQYTAAGGAIEGTRTYELCYKCHSRSVILSDVSFPGHAEHVVTSKTSCYGCHDSHGSPSNSGLIRFGKDIRYTDASPSSSGRLEYDPDSQTCRVTCHGVNHDPLGYGL